MAADGAWARKRAAGIGNRDLLLGAGYAVTLQVFEGPLDLLLHLIEREELDISEVSLVEVTDPYLRTLEQLEEIEPGALADFLVVASKLLFIKSARLLPKPPVTDSAEDEDSSASLIQHLLEYRQFRQAAGALRRREEGGLRVYVRPSGGVEVVDLPRRPPDLGDVDLGMLHVALRRALQRMPVDPPPPKVHPYTVTVAEQMDAVRRVLAQVVKDGRAGVERKVIPFVELLSQGASRLEIIVTFLAVLELIKQREVRAMQSATFGEIVLAPAYADKAGESQGVEAEEDQDTEAASDDA